MAFSSLPPDSDTVMLSMCLLRLFQYGEEGWRRGSEVGASGSGPPEPEILEKSLSFETLFSHLGKKDNTSYSWGCCENEKHCL